ncbi:GMC oxidoreductase [Xylariaceae sp. FL0594]|nr:GMC oxidoreductase [Xylariaceae sp. FL0594]
MPSEICDVVIIGGGTAGLVLANRLSEDDKLQVVVLESGNDRTGDMVTLTPGAWPLLPESPDQWLFPANPQTDLKRAIKIPQGKALGGSSAVNSFLFTSTSKLSVETWEKLGNHGWGFAEFDQALKKSFTLHKLSGGSEGEGPLQLSLAEPESVWEKAWIEGLQSVGYPRADALSGRLGGPVIAAESIDPKTKQRSYATNAYYDPVRKRSNLVIRTDTTVTKILLDKSSSTAVAKGVQYMKDGVSATIEARKEVILCAGAINSPRVLELSGIGGAGLLKRLGIDVVVDNPHVGENLQNHVFTGLVFNVKDGVDTLDAFFRQEEAAQAAANQDYASGKGPLATSNMITMAQLPLPDFHSDTERAELERLLNVSPSSDVSTPAFAAVHKAFVQSVLTSPSEAVGNYVLGPAYAPFDSPGLDPKYRAPGKYIAIAVKLSHPLSRGSVHVTSSDASLAATNEGVKVDCRYLSHPLDIEVLARQLRFMEDLVLRAEPIAQHLLDTERRFADLEKSKQFVRDTADGAYHYTGTCAMMGRDMGGVVDDRLRVYGVKGLRVCDASVIPLEPTANPQAIVYAVAERAAELIKEDLKSEV